MRTLILITFILLSYGTRSAQFKNCEPNICEQLTMALIDGVPHFIEQIRAEKSIKLEQSEITLIEQFGNQFKVWSKETGIYHFKYKCFDGTPCLFVWDGTRTVF